MPPTRRGFTLYELLITLLLLAVIASVGLPSFEAMLARSRQSVEINALFHAFHHARKESIMRRRAVTLCPSEDGRRCATSGNWSHGWIMSHDPDQSQDNSGAVVIVAHRVQDGIRVTSNRRSFALRTTVRRATNGTIVVCDAQDRVRPRALIVSYTGRPRVALERRDGTPWSCAD
jgi:type IV fimbrial biogenesis protein FimT